MISFFDYEYGYDNVFIYTYFGMEIGARVTCPFCNKTTSFELLIPESEFICEHCKQQLRFVKSGL